MSYQDHRLCKRLLLPPTVLEEAYYLIAEIDSVKKSWVLTEKLMPQTIERLTQSVIITSTGSSNRIEGNRLSDQEVETIYRNMNIKKLKSRDEQEVVGYLETLEFIFKNYPEVSLSESFILQLHQEMLKFSEKDQHHIGSYKVGSNRVEAKDPIGNIVGIIFDPTPPYLVQKEMEELLAWYHWEIAESKRHPLLIIANFIFEYLAIHPFLDGNGRTSRLLTNLLLLQKDYLFTSLVSHEKIIETQKVDYYLALNKTQSTWKKDQEDVAPWLLFFLQIIKKQSSQALDLIQNDSINTLLSEKQLALWEWALLHNQEFSRKDAIKALNFPPRTVEQIIKKLVELKRLIKLGEGKATRYKPINH